MTLKAKPIVKNQFWILTDGVSKVGALQSSGSGYDLQLGRTHRHFDSTSAIRRMVSIEFERRPAIKQSIPYAVWPTTGKTYNNMFDVKRKLHVYTKSKKSRCYHAAGWFNMQLGESWTTVFCPKYIFIQRYPYVGPFSSAEEASKHK